MMEIMNNAGKVNEEHHLWWPFDLNWLDFFFGHRG
jgi:hypothetical protein